MLNESFRTEALLHVTVHPRKCLIWLDTGELKIYQTASLGVRNAVLTYMSVAGFDLDKHTCCTCSRVHKPKTTPMVYRVLEFQKLCGSAHCEYIMIYLKLIGAFLMV